MEDIEMEAIEMEAINTEAIKMEAINMRAPVYLIENLQDGSLQVNAEAVEILSKIKQPLVVVAIVGLYRTGKSYLMNKLAGVQKGFELSAAVQAKTKGIWMWCVPHPTMKDHTLVLLDTEGLGNVRKGDRKNDLKIFCLSVLLSSVLVYNSRGTIDEDAVKKLRFVGELAGMIKVKSKDNENDEGQFSRHFPAFIWAVRDFTLMLELDGKEITEDEYLENALLPQEWESTEGTSNIQEYNRCRDAIRMYFSTRNCFVFDLPSGDKKVLQKMDTVKDEELASSFVDQCQKFCDYIYKNSEVKVLDDIKLVSGEILGQLVYKYTEDITSSSVVCMEDTVMRVSEMENKEAVQEATEHYEKMMRKRGKFPTETLEEFIELSAQCEEEATQIFMNKSFNDSELSYHRQFMRNTKEKKREFSKKNEVASHNYCDQLIKKHSRELEEALRQDLYSNKPGGYQKFQEDMKLIEERYNSEPRKGVKAASVLHDFIKSKDTFRMSIMKIDQDLTKQQKMKEEDDLNTLNMKRENEIQELKSANETMVAEDQKKTLSMHLNQQLNRTKNDNSKRQEKLDHVIQAKCRECNTYMSRGLTSHARTYDDQIEMLCRERSAEEDPQCLERVADLFREDAAEMLGSSYAGNESTSRFQSQRTNPNPLQKHLRRAEPLDFETAEYFLDYLNFPGTQQKQMSGKHVVGIFSRSPQREHYWLRDLLKSAAFQGQVQEVKYGYIQDNLSGNARKMFEWEVSECTFGILCHSKRNERALITDVPGSLYDYYLKHLSSRLGKKNVLVVIDDMEDQSGEEKEWILAQQPSLHTLARDVLFFGREKTAIQAKDLPI
ncbi:guanylate-binding protein 5-like isoform X2 [Aquarana catesbeiana]|uniref:guanylate-binding protein 5-like isoform X2 n=1 Tax=Aquarana catesbeiana TaxID=8400 RepID=UPI003CCA3D8D